MKLKDIIGAICMVLLTISGLVLSFGLAINSVISSDGILSIMIEKEYLEKSETEAKTVLTHYMSEEKAQEILENISTKSHIRQITAAFDSNSVEQVAAGVKNEIKQSVLNSIQDNSTSDSKETFATVVSDAYIKSIFPVTEFNLLSNLYSKLNSKLNLAIVMTSIIAVVIYIYIATGKKTYKWAIIALYNIVILNIVALIIMGIFDGIVIGNERTTDVIIGMIDKVKLNVIVATIITFALSIISNYIAYFKKRKHSK